MEIVTIGEKSLNCSQWAKELGVTRGAISFRKMKFGETAKEAVTHFYNKRKYGGDAYRLRFLLGSALFTLDALVSDDKFLAKLEDIVSSIKTVRKIKEQLNSMEAPNEK